MLAVYVKCLNDWNNYLNAAVRTANQIKEAEECAMSLGIDLLDCYNFKKALEENRNPCSLAQDIPCTTLNCFRGVCVFSPDNRFASCLATSGSICDPGQTCDQGMCVGTTTTTATTSSTTSTTATTTTTASSTTSTTDPGPPVITGLTQDGCAYSAQSTTTLCQFQQGHDVVNTVTVSYDNGACPVTVEWTDVSGLNVYSTQFGGCGAGHHTSTWYLCCFGSIGCFYNGMTVKDGLGRTSTTAAFSWMCTYQDYSNAQCRATFPCVSP